MERRLDPGPASDSPYEAEVPKLPHPLSEAIAALRGDKCLRDGLGSAFVEYYALIKKAELARFEAEVTDWEQREYFELF
jgi:glutamine synthetase